MDNKRVLRHNGKRKEAGFGAEIAAAGITAAATLTAAGIGANAAKEAAQQQADAALKSAKQNAEALRLQNENSNELQQRSIAFTREQNEQNRQLQRDIQTTLQMMAGQESMANRKQASKIQVRNGGSTSKINRKISMLNPYKRKRLQNSIKNYNREFYDDVDMDLLTRIGLIDDYDYGEMFKPNRLTAKYGKSFLRGSDNMPFRITDGGGVIPVGVTPEGFELYELYGNDHNHYHKAQGGKNKTGVGIKFGNGVVIEGEGNQKSNNGELLLTTPEGGYFISKHSINGFNPAEAVKQGMHPAVAFQTQELIKDMTGISDDGKHNSTPVKKRKLRLAGGEAENIMTQYFPQGIDFSTDVSVPAAGGIIYSLQNQDNITRPQSKNGCSTKRTLGRRKAVGGYGVAALNDYQVSRLGMPNINVSSINTNGVGGSSNWLDNNAQFIGAGINTLGNIGGALVTNLGNNRAANVLADAYGQAADITADAYSRMTGIDMSNLRREDYSSAHYLPAIRSAFYNANPELANSERKRTRLRDAVRRNSLSSAAMLSRLAKIEVDSADERNKIYADKANREEAIHQANNQAINEAAEINAKLDSQANRDYANAYLNLLQYNNDINNEKLAGIAQARSAGITNAAGVRASTRQANSNAWANAISQSGLAFGNAFAVTGKQIQDKNNVMLGADNDAYFRNLWMHGSASEKAAAKAKLSELINRTSGKTREQYQTWYDMMG